MSIFPQTFKKVLIADRAVLIELYPSPFSYKTVKYERIVFIDGLTGLSVPLQNLCHAAIYE